jgi:hypothetical protein
LAIDELHENQGNNYRNLLQCLDRWNFALEQDNLNYDSELLISAAGRRNLASLFPAIRGLFFLSARIF